MSIDLETVKRVADLARLNLSEEEAQVMQKDMASILDYAQRLDAIDVEGVEPTFFVAPQENVFREDQVSPSRDVEEVLSNAPSRIARYFRLPKVVDKEH